MTTRSAPEVRYRAYLSVPLTQREAFAFVTEHHRTHQAPRGALFCIGAAQADEIIGVVVVGRPVARGLQDAWTAVAWFCGLRPSTRR